VKRSRINDIIRNADEMIRSHGFTLPGFAYLSPDQFRARRDQARHIIDARCGWDITDYGVLLCAVQTQNLTKVVMNYRKAFYQSHLLKYKST